MKQPTKCGILLKARGHNGGRRVNVYSAPPEGGGRTRPYRRLERWKGGRRPVRGKAAELADYTISALTASCRRKERNPVLQEVEMYKNEDKESHST